MDNKDYYLFKGFLDGSGCPKGIIIRYYTEQQADHVKSCGFVLIKIPSKESN